MLKRIYVTGDRPDSRVPNSELDFDAELTYRWHDALFTGIGYEESPDGRLSEISYRNGMQEGPARDWDSAGNLKVESNFRENILHGLSRIYAADGTLTEEVAYEYGIIVEQREQNSLGKLVTAFIVTPESQLYALLERYRREKEWPT
jgi:hypothetical protein